MQASGIMLNLPRRMKQGVTVFLGPNFYGIDALHCTTDNLLLLPKTWPIVSVAFYY